MKHSKKDIARYTLSLVLLLVFIYFIGSIDRETLEKVSTTLGVWGPVFFVFIIFCTHIFAPLSGTALYLAGIKLYGYETSLVLYYLTCLLSATASFYIARKWGRKVVVKLIGKKSMDHIDQMTEKHEQLLLVSGRTFGYFFFDFVSYALGFTKVSFKKYFTYTATLTLIPILLLYMVFKNFDFTSVRGMTIYYGLIIIAAVVFGYIFRKIMKAKK